MQNGDSRGHWDMRLSVLLPGPDAVTRLISFISLSTKHALGLQFRDSQRQTWALPSRSSRSIGGGLPGAPRSLRNLEMKTL